MIFGINYFQKMRTKELERKWANAFVEVKETIQSENELCKFVESTEYDRINMSTDLPYKIYLIKDYSSNESVVILKISHTHVDGVGALLLACGV